MSLTGSLPMIKGRDKTDKKEGIGVDLKKKRGLT